MIEDSDVDAMIFQRALNDIGVANALVHQTNGEEALDYINDTETLPVVIFLDLNMPIMNGVEFLEERILLARLKSIPVIVYSSSDRDADKQRCLELEIDDFLVKPVSYNDFLERLRSINGYWDFKNSSM